jgi:hypothetical protein
MLIWLVWGLVGLQGRLMDTMTFAEALPALRTRQWHVVVMLFLDALSVHHLPSISSIMANRSLQLHKVNLDPSNSMCWWYIRTETTFTRRTACPILNILC